MTVEENDAFASFNQTFATLGIRALRLTRRGAVDPRWYASVETDKDETINAVGVDPLDALSSLVQALTDRADKTTSRGVDETSHYRSEG